MNLKKLASIKILFLILTITLILPFISAERFEDNLFRFGEINPSGTLIPTNTPINNVGVSGYICSSANCNSVLRKLWPNTFNSGSNNPKDFIQLIYPTSLKSPYGYGVYMYKDGYIPYEVAANWWGTCSSCDPTGPWNNYLTRKEICQSNINEFQVNQNNNQINVQLNIQAPISNDGPLNYVPPELEEHYSTTVEVNLEVKKDNTIVHTESKTLTIQYSQTKDTEFNFDITQGNYEIRVYTTLDSEDKCIDYTEDERIEIITTEECTIDSDCPDDYYEDDFCISNSIYKYFHNYECASSECIEDISQIFIEECAYGCDDGTCQGECTTETNCGIDYSTAPYCIGDDSYYDFHDFSCLSENCQEDIFTNLIEECAYSCVDGTCQGECTEDSDCEDDYYGDNYCSNDDVYKDLHDFGCTSDECQEDITPELVEECADQCVNGECIDMTCTEDQDCDDNDVYTYDECNIPNTPQSYCTNTPINCITNNDCGITGFTGTEFCASNDLFKNFKTSTCINPGTTQSHCFLSSSSTLIQDCGNDQCESWDQNFCQGKNIYKSRTCYDKGCALDSCFSNVFEDTRKVQNCLFGCEDGECTDPECTIDSQCGTDHTEYFCVGDDRYSEFIDFECTNFQCSDSTSQNLIETCDYGCANGECLGECTQETNCGIDYSTAPYCIEDDSYYDFHDFSCLSENCQEDIFTNLIEECAYSCVDGTCQGECTEDSDCEDDYYGDNYCQDDDVYKDLHNFFCDSSKECQKEIIPELVKECALGCSDGECESIFPDCMDNKDNDGDGLVDMDDPGCECPTHNDETDCYTNSDCGIDAYTGDDNFCQNNDVFQLFDIYTCNNQGQGISFCSQTIEPVLMEECGNSDCENGECPNSNNNNPFKKTKKPKSLSSLSRAITPSNSLGSSLDTIKDKTISLTHSSLFITLSLITISIAGFFVLSLRKQ